MEYVAWIYNLSSLSSQSIFYPLNPSHLAKWLRLKYLFMSSLFLYFKDMLAHFQKKAHLLSNHLQNAAAVSDCLSNAVSRGFAWWFFSPWSGTFLRNVVKCLNIYWATGTCHVLTCLCFVFDSTFKFISNLLWLVTRIIAWSLPWH